MFSVDRVLRIDWIEYVLKNPKAELHLGWDRIEIKKDIIKIEELQ